MSDTDLDRARLKAFADHRATGAVGSAFIPVLLRMAEDGIAAREALARIDATAASLAYPMTDDGAVTASPGATAEAAAPSSPAIADGGNP